MDMTNATQASPSHGLLDLIFGTAPKEGGEVNTAEGDPISALVKALEKQGAKIAESKEIQNLNIPQDYIMTTGESTKNISTVQINNEPVQKKLESDEKLIEILGGNLALVTVLSQLNPSPEAITSLKNNDNSHLLKLIEARKAELKKQMPSLEILERKVEKEGLEKAVSTDSIRKLVEHLENQYTLIKKQPAGITTQDFLQNRGVQNKNLPISKNEMIETNKDASSIALLTAGGEQLKQKNNLVARENMEKMMNASTSDAKFSNMLASRDLLNSTNQVANNNLGGSKNEVASSLAKDTTNISLDKNQLNNFDLATDTLSAGGIGASVLANKEGLFTEVTIDNSTKSLRSSLIPKMAHNISYMAKSGVDELNMTIFPKDMGEVHLKIATKGQMVQVEITTQHNDVAQVIRSSSNELMDALKSQNLQISGFDVVVRSDKLMAPLSSDLMSNNNFSSFNSSSDQNWNNNPKNPGEAFQNFSQQFQQSSQQTSQQTYEDNLSKGKQSSVVSNETIVPKNNFTPKKSSNNNVDIKV